MFKKSITSQIFLMQDGLLLPPPISVSRACRLLFFNHVNSSEKTSEVLTHEAVVPEPSESRY